MGRYRINGEIIQADSPEQAAKKYTAKQPTTEKKKGSSLLSPLMQGMTFGFADELGGVGARLGAALAGAGPERRDKVAQQETDRQREQLAATRKEHFWPSMALEGGGALVSGGPAFKALQGLGRGMGLGRIAAPILAGATEGGIAGAGSADENKLLGAGLGATLGGGLTAAMPAVGGLATATGGKLKPYGDKLYEMTFGGPQSTASRVIGETMESGGVTPTLMRARQRQLGPEATFVDVAGDPGLSLGQGVIQKDKSGQALTNARRAMSKRAGGSTKRLDSDIRGTTGINKTLNQSLDEVRTRQKEAAGPLYETAFERGIEMTDQLKDILKRPSMKKAFRAVKDSAEDRGQPLPEFFNPETLSDEVVPDLRALDRMKQGIDSLIEGQTDSVTGKVSPRGRDLVMMKKDLLKELDKNSIYADARAAFAGDAEIQNAMRDGERFLTMKTREVSKAMDDATASEKEAFLTGAVEAIREKMGRARSGEIGEFRFLELANTRKKLRSMFPKGNEGDRQAGELMRTLNRERIFASNQGGLVGGTQTALRQAAGDALESGVSMPTSTEAIANPLGSGLNAAIQAASGSLKKTGPKALKEMGNMMFDPDQLNRTILEMERRGASPVDIMKLMQRYSRGGARVSPLAGLGAGEMTNDGP